uniref:Fragile site-associated protein n=1 Tax=Apis cerana TaxID=7461 RepID=V9IHF6_APICE
MPQQMLSAIGSGNVNNVSSLDSLGSNLSLVGNMETMRIDIVVSEFGKVTDKRKGNKYQTKKEIIQNFIWIYHQKHQHFYVKKSVLILMLRKWLI